MSKQKVTRLFGHPLHAMLTDFPLALLATATLADLASFLIDNAELAAVGYWCELGGLVTGGVVALTGLADLIKLSSDKDILQPALRHAGFALLAVSLYVVAFVLRAQAAAFPVPTAVLVLEVAGALVLGATGWFGGHLVFHHGVGVRSSGPHPSEEHLPR